MTKFLKRGQITLVAVVLGVVGLTLGLAVASRSLSDLRQASTVDFGTKALAAAESAAEYALSQINSQGALAANCGNPRTDLLTTLNFGTALNIQGLEYEICLTPATAQTIAQDGVYQVDFGSAGTSTAPLVYWSAAPGVEVVAVYANQYKVTRYAYRTGSNLSNSGFTPAASGSCSSVNGFVSDAIPAVDTGNNLILLRVKPIAGPGTIIVCANGSPIGNQQYQVTAKATTKNGLVKRVRVTRDVSGVLPGVFDNVLYSGGNITKN